MRKLIAQSFARFYRDNPDTHRMNLKMLDAQISTFDLVKSEAQKASKKHLGNEVFLAQLPAATLCYLIFSTGDEHGENTLLRSDFPANDYQVSCQLTRLVNTSLCVVHLARDGFDTQARILLRTLLESINQTLVLFSDPDDYAAYKNAETSADTKQIHYQLFSRKGRLFKKIMELEQQLGVSKEDSESLNEWRKSASDYYGEVVHHGVFSTAWGSLASDFEDDTVMPALLGRASPFARPTLRDVSHQMTYFCLIFHQLLLETHGWTPDSKVDATAKYLALHNMLVDIAAAEQAMPVKKPFAASKTN